MPIQNDFWSLMGQDPALLVIVALVVGVAAISFFRNRSAKKTVG